MTSADPLDTLRRRTSEKWGLYPDDVLPLFVAEMDFPLAPAISAALHAAVDDGDTGYINPHDRRAAEAFAAFAEDTWDWAPSADRIVCTTDVSVVIVESLRRLIARGDGVIVSSPIYPPFFDLVAEAGGTVVDVPLADDGIRYSLDLAGIDRAFADGARVLLLCSPHNPVGLVHSRATLEALSEIVARHDARVIADEIHAPLVHSHTTFVPYLTVSDAAREHTIAAESASKAFNLAGLKCGFFVTASDRMTAVVEGMPSMVRFRAGLLGLIATRAGFADSREWLAQTVSAVEANVTLLEDELASKLPGVRLRRPDAGYLAWLDFSALGWGDDPARFALESARVALTGGLRFGAVGAGHARMNLACAPETVTEAVDRLAAADERRRSA